jgi:hypothetical protein
MLTTPVAINKRFFKRTFFTFTTSFKDICAPTPMAFVFKLAPYVTINFSGISMAKYVLLRSASIQRPRLCPIDPGDTKMVLPRREKGVRV